MSSKRSSISLRGSPRIEALRYTFSRPVSSGWNPAPSSSSADTRPLMRTLPFSGCWMPAIMRSNVDLPEPLWPTSPYTVPRSISSDTSLSAQKSS